MATQNALEKAKIDQIQKRIKEQIVKEYSKLVTGIDENLRAFINTIINEDFTAQEFWKEDNLIYIPVANQKAAQERSSKKDSDVQEISPRKSPVYPSQPRRTNYPVVPQDQQRRRPRQENEQEAAAERNKVNARETNIKERVEPPRRQNRRGNSLMITYDESISDIQEVAPDTTSRGGADTKSNYAKIFRNYSDGKQPSNGRNPPISIREELSKRSEQAKEMAPPPPRTNGRVHRESSIATIPREQPIPRATRDSAGVKPASRMNSPAVNNRSNIKVQNAVEEAEDKKVPANLPNRNTRNDRKRPNPVIPNETFEDEPARAKRRNVEKPKGRAQSPITKPDKEEVKSPYSTNKPAQVKKTLNDIKASVKKDIEDVKVEKTTNGFKCHQCGNKSHTAQDLAMHLEFFHKSKGSAVSNSNPPSSFNCTQCGYDGRSKLDLERHKIQTHGKVDLPVLPQIPAVKSRGAFKCERCPYSSNKRMYLNQHMKHTHNA